MTTISSQITSMQNQTTYNNLNKQLTSAADATEDSQMFLTLMLQQLQNQDPTEPTSNTEWLAQLAQYSSLEQMTQMNQGLEDCMSYLSAFYNDTAANSEITQTLSLIGKEVTIKIPKDLNDPKSEEKTIKGTVSEASFEEGSGKVKVDGEYYSIANIISVRDKSLES
ncbi:hypothetical protein IJD34_04805 [bacterium]|nr:hypothetical protein [bacterium]